MSAPREVCLVQPVRIRSERRLAAGSELNPAPDRVTGHREARGMGYRATTQVKGLSPVIPVIPVADAGSSLFCVGKVVDGGMFGG